MNAKPLTFLASIAPLQSAIMVASDGGCRMKLDLPETEMGKIKRLLDLRGKVLKVTIEAVRQTPQGDTWGDDDDDTDAGGDTG